MITLNDLLLILKNNPEYDNVVINKTNYADTIILYKDKRNRIWIKRFCGNYTCHCKINKQKKDSINANLFLAKPLSIVIRDKNRIIINCIQNFFFKEMLDKNINVFYLKTPYLLLIDDYIKKSIIKENMEDYQINNIIYKKKNCNLYTIV